MNTLTPLKYHPTTFGVFKPIDHVLMSFAAASNAEGASLALRLAGFGEGDVIRYTPAEMQAQAEVDIANASAMASLGQELNLVKAQLELALQGQCFVLVRAPQDDQVKQVAAVALKFEATRAQRYGTLLIEELVPVGATDRQVPESPETGLDAQTLTRAEQSGSRTMPLTLGTGAATSYIDTRQ
jgi:hypothetical protein